MANFTENLNLKKPLQTEFYNVDDFNENADIIDENLGEVLKHCENYSNPHKTTADSVKASKMFTSGEINTYTTLLDACNALKYGGGFVVSSVSPICNADDYPQKGYEYAFNVVCESNGARKAVIAYMYHGGRMNVFQRNIFNGAWETEWKSTDESYLSLSGGTITGSLGIGGGIASFGAIEQYLSLAHKEAPNSNNYRNFSISNGAEVEDSLILHEVRNGTEVAAYRIFGEHNKHLMGVSFIGVTESYSGTGLNTYDATAKKDISKLDFDFDFPVKILMMGRRTFLPKGTGNVNDGAGTSEDAYHYVNTAPINIETLLLNDYNGKGITTKVPLHSENNYATIAVSADRRHITITSDIAIQGMNESGGYYYYIAMG